MASAAQMPGIKRTELISVQPFTSSKHFSDFGQVSWTCGRICTFFGRVHVVWGKFHLFWASCMHLGGYPTSFGRVAALNQVRIKDRFHWMVPAHYYSSTFDLYQTAIFHWSTATALCLLTWGWRPKAKGSGIDFLPLSKSISKLEVWILVWSDLPSSLANPTNLIQIG